MDYEVEGVRPRGKPKKAWSEAVEQKDSLCQLTDAGRPHIHRFKEAKCRVVLTAHVHSWIFHSIAHGQCNARPWLRGTVAEHWSLARELSLSCTQPAADW